MTSRALSSLVLYHDKSLIVLQKPPGLVCQSSNPQQGPNDFFRLLQGLGNAFGSTPPVPVHRLDQGTTGALVLGRTKTAANVLSKEFQARRVGKSYLALVRGGEKTFPNKSGVIRTPIIYKDGWASPDFSMKEKPSITEWEVLSSCPTAPLSLLRLKLVTGHKHQLRVHLAHCLGAPILGDTQYSRKPLSPAVKNLTNIPDERIFLHASHISFLRYKRTGPKKCFRLGITAPLPGDFLKICRDLSINVDSNDVEGGVWVNDMRIEDGRVPELAGEWIASKKKTINKQRL